MTTVGSRFQVFNRTADCTAGGLTRGDLRMNKRNKIVSRKMSDLAKKTYKNTGFNAFVTAAKKGKNKDFLKMPQIKRYKSGAKRGDPKPMKDQPAAYQELIEKGKKKKAARKKKKT
jgi:hypothetical protein